MAQEICDVLREWSNVWKRLYMVRRQPLTHCPDKCSWYNSCCCTLTSRCMGLIFTLCSVCEASEFVYSVGMLEIIIIIAVTALLCSACGYCYVEYACFHC